MALSTERADAISSDVALSALRHERRRHILRLLANADEGPVTITALIDKIAARGQSEELSEEEHRKRVNISLQHIHLPKLESQELLSYDSETGHVEQRSSTLIQELLAVIELHELGTPE